MKVRSCVAFLSIWCWSDFAVLAMRGPHHPKDQVVRSHTHYKPVPPSQGKDHVKLTQDSQLIHDEDHIREDMSGQVSPDALKNMTPEEMEFYYFKLHDFDNDSRLDGLELLKAIEHTMHEENEHNHDEKDDQSTKEKRRRLVEEDLFYYTQLIDEVLLSDDTNNDGYLSYEEYAIGKKKGQSKTNALGQEMPKVQLMNGQTST